MQIPPRSTGFLPRRLAVVRKNDCSSFTPSRKEYLISRGRDFFLPAFAIALCQRLSISTGNQNPPPCPIWTTRTSWLMNSFRTNVLAREKCHLREIFFYNDAIFQRLNRKDDCSAQTSSHRRFLRTIL